MIGAIAGDIIGSVYEPAPIKTKDFPLFHPRGRFTDDSVLTVAIADALLTGRSYRDAVRDWGRRYPRASYGSAFFDMRVCRTPRRSACASRRSARAMRAADQTRFAQAFRFCSASRSLALINPTTTTQGIVTL